jgi:DNA-binding response OmpR family regulator
MTLLAARRNVPLERARSASRTPRKRASTRDPLVLLVEDHDDSREGYASYFRFRGLRVMTAIDGREALDLATRLSPDIIVMDLGLPRMDGWTAIRELRSQPRTSGVKILTLSAHSSDEEVRHAWSSGTDAFRAKPCLPNELLDEIWRLLRRPQGGSSDGGSPGRGRGSGRTRGRSPRRGGSERLVRGVLRS